MTENEIMFYKLLSKLKKEKATKNEQDILKKVNKNTID